MSTQFTKAPRLSRVEREDCPPEWRDAYDHVIKSRGHTSLANVFSFLANSPGAMQAVTSVGEHVRFKTDFDAVLRELVIMTVAQELECVYEWSHHWAVALKAGATEALLKKVGSKELEAEPMPVGPAVTYARLLTHNKPVDDALRRLHGRFGHGRFLAAPKGRQAVAQRRPIWHAPAASGATRPCRVRH